MEWEILEEKVSLLLYCAFFSDSSQIISKTLSQLSLAKGKFKTSFLHSTGGEFFAGRRNNGK
jgi:hypothetical protein